MRIDIDPWFSPSAELRTQVATEVDDPSWERPGKVWWVAKSPEIALMGWCGLWCREDGVIVWESHYTMPAYRRQGVMSALLQHRDTFTGQRPVVTWVAPAMIKPLRKLGLEVTAGGISDTGYKWAEMRRG